MNKLLYTVYDEKGGIYSDPMTALNEESAIRDFTYACTQDENTYLYRHTIDYHLFKIAEYDNQEGTFTINKKLLISGTELLPLKQKIASERRQSTQENTEE